MKKINSFREYTESLFLKRKCLMIILTFLEEAKKRDHRRLGKELELFMFSQKIGAGLPGMAS